MKSLILGIAAGGLLMGSVSFAQTSQGGSPGRGVADRLAIRDKQYCCGLRFRRRT